MMDGIYGITFRGAADWGMGMLLLQRGVITGVDANGVMFDGTFAEIGEDLRLAGTMTVPPGVRLVQGTAPQPNAFRVPFDTTFPKRVIGTAEPILINLQPGPVNVLIRLLRPL